MLTSSNSNSIFDTYSIIMLTMRDVNYTFTAIDIAAYGFQRDDGVMFHSVFGGRLELPKTKNNFNQPT
uniref:Uncharacterized protein n=1 Tax=Glossina pallidipes TaxID=7398 RepID=A0A1A9ZYY5_GLOPL